VERSDIPSAIIYSERRRARVLVDRLTGTKSATATPEARAALDRLRAEKRDLEQRLGKCQAQAQALRSKPKLTKAERSELARIESNCDDIARDVERIGERIRGMPGVHGPKAVPAVAALARDEPQLLYHIGTLSSYVFVWGAGAADARVYSLVLNASAATTLGVPAGALTRAGLARIFTGYDEKGERSGIGIVRELAESQAANIVTERAREQTQGRLHALFTVLVPEEVWTSVRKATEVVVITDGPLAAFPFEAFIVSAAKDAVYWLDDGPAIRYAPSIAALAALAQTPRRASSPRVLSVCNPHYAALDPLPGTVRETESVVGAFGKNQVTVLCGEDATEAAARRAMAGKKIVHLATHGLINQRRSDLLASLAFTPSTSASKNLHDDGFLQLFEIDDLALSAELVVLSACESSTGSYVLGEGVMALSRGFLSAGARRVVATQWKVDDATTAVLVGDFLARVAHDPSADMALALRDAKRAVRQSANTSQPFYWAAFVITGAR
jgi:CHAT domain-containing protein